MDAIFNSLGDVLANPGFFQPFFMFLRFGEGKA
jgi:hypothetical protein